MGLFEFYVNLFVILILFVNLSNLVSFNYFYSNFSNFKLIVLFNLLF